MSRTFCPETLTGVVGKVANAPLHDADGLLRRMIAARLVVLADHAVPAKLNAPDGLAKIGPCLSG
jgi:hypothetical protein